MGCLMNTLPKCSLNNPHLFRRFCLSPLFKFNNYKIFISSFIMPRYKKINPF